MPRKRCNCPCGARLSKLDFAAVLTVLALVWFVMFVIVVRWREFLQG